MSDTFKTIAITGYYADETTLATIIQLIGILNERGCKLVASANMPDSIGDLVDRAPKEQLAGLADLLIAVGGDGTMLSACRLAAAGQIPVLGINRGRLGFLTDISPDSMREAIDEVFSGNFTLEKRMLVKGEVWRGEELIASGLGMNDIVLKRQEPARMVEFKTLINGQYVNTHGGDGMIAATPTGSTAYALSCGGPIMQPLLDAFVLAPICPHTLSDRPLVVPAVSVTDIILMDNHGSKADVSGDGELLAEMIAGDRLRIEAADTRVQLIHPPGYDYYEVLRDKLYWGRDTRDTARQKP